MLKNALLISFAFIGTVVGAGFASGQEAMLYFSAFGTQGLWGAVLGSALMLIAGVTILQLGSFFQAKEHMEVLGSISSKVMGWILDIATIGFGMLDVDKVTGAIGALTPFLLIFVIVGCGWTLINNHPDWEALNAAAAQVDSSLPNWWISALNYTGLNVMCVVSMALVIGGNQLDTRAAGLGGLFGGIGYLVMLMLLAMALLVKIETVEGQDMPLLTLIADINPTMGLIMSLVIFGMIFATCLGMFFALGKRLSRGREDKFRIIFISACLIGFVLSFVGFQQLVSTVYPILGYLGLLLIVVMTLAWIRGIPKLRKEGDRRRRALELTRKKMDPAERFTKNDERELEYLTAKSNVDEEELVEALEEEVAQELLDDEESEFEEEDIDNPSDVVYVSYTDPVSADEYAANPDEPWNDRTVDDMIAAEEAEEAAGQDNSLGGDANDEEDAVEETGGSTAVSAKGTGSTKL